MSATAQRLAEEWTALVDEHLPVRHDGSIWRSSAPGAPVEPVNQGWKLHVSTSLPGATDTLRRCARVLTDAGVRWKAAGSLADVNRLNSGLFHGYAQIGKIITAYPVRADAAAGLADRLDRELAGAGAAGPAVPFDRPYRRGSVVYYRYGVIDALHHVEVDGRRTPALRAPDGELVPDVRAAAGAVPAWVPDTVSTAHTRAAGGRLPRSYLVHDVITQRGKGGVYRAFDLAADPPRRCVVKEGRRHGETGWDGRDGRRRVAHERAVLVELAAAGVAVPRVYAAFVRGGHQYVVLEHVDGSSLAAEVAGGGLGPDAAVRLGGEIAGQLAAMHAAGWAWRDCKAQNIMVTGSGPVLLDVEGACRLRRPDREPWGSPGHLPPEWPDPRHVVAHDRYALGVVLHQMLTGRLPGSGRDLPGSGRDLPPELVAVVAGLLDPDPLARPGADVVHAVLGGLAGPDRRNAVNSR